MGFTSPLIIVLLIVMSMISVVIQGDFLNGTPFCIGKENPEKMVKKRFYSQNSSNRDHFAARGDFLRSFHEYVISGFPVFSTNEKERCQSAQTEKSEGTRLRHGAD